MPLSRRGQVLEPLNTVLNTTNQSRRANRAAQPGLCKPVLQPVAIEKQRAEPNQPTHRYHADNHPAKHQR